MIPDLLQLPETEGVELGAEGVLSARGLDERAALGGEGADLGQGRHGVGDNLGHERREVEAEVAGGLGGGGGSARVEPGLRLGSRHFTSYILQSAKCHTRSMV